MRRLLATVALATLTACSGELGTPTEPLRLLSPRLSEAVLDEPYSASVLATGGLRPYTFSLDSGALPPGVTLSGGSLIGTPTELGTFEFTVSVSDANLASTFQNLVLRVVEVPPPSLTFTPPLTEVQTAVTLRGRVTGARALDALRTVIRFDPDRFEAGAEGAVASRADIALFSEVEPGIVRVDVALLGSPLSGDAELFRIELTPREPTTLELESETEYLFAGRHHFASTVEGTPPADEPVVEEPVDGLPGDGDPTQVPDPEGDGGGQLMAGRQRNVGARETLLRLAAGALALLSVASATGYLELSLDEMLAGAEVAVFAEVVAIETEVADGLPWTLVELQIDRDLLQTFTDLDDPAADEPETETLILPFLGGALPDGARLTIEAMPLFEVGERILVLAYRERYASPIVGFRQGLWREDALGLSDETGRRLSLDAEGAVQLDGTGAGTEALLQALERLLAERP